MGVYDQAARYAAQAEPEAVIARLLRDTGEPLSFGRDFDTRTVPLPGGPDRTGDLAVILTGPVEVAESVLLMIEFQARHDEDKLDATFLAAAQYRHYARHGPDRRGKFNVQTALVYLTDRCPARELRMQLAGGSGSVHTCLVWDVAGDAASQTLDDVTAGRATWGALFWVALQTGAGDATVIQRWKDLVAERVTTTRTRSDMAGIALVFAELAGCLRAWQDALGGWGMTESQVVNGWQEQARREGTLAAHRRDLLTVLGRRFPGQVTAELRDFIQQQDSGEMLHDWLTAALDAAALDDFMVILRR